MWHFITIFVNFSCLILIYGPQQHGLKVLVVLPKPSWFEFVIGFLIWTPASKHLHLTTFSNICVILSMFLLFFNWLKMPKKSQTNEYSDLCMYTIDGGLSFAMHSHHVALQVQLSIHGGMMLSWCTLVSMVVGCCLGGCHVGCGSPGAMIEENRQLVTDEPVEFEK